MHVRETKKNRLRYRLLSLFTFKIFSVSDSHFANNDKQWIFIFLDGSHYYIKDKPWLWKILSFAIYKFKRVLLSLASAEAYAMADFYDEVHTICEELLKIRRCAITVPLLTYSKCISNWQKSHLVRPNNNPSFIFPYGYKGGHSFPVTHYLESKNES